jgi:tRNA G10  N-methylase Trm11
MVNLSEVKENEILMDCFCGVGVVMIEALNMGIKTMGIDKDANAIEGARKNLEWMKFPVSGYKLINNDSSKVKISPVNVLVSEPDFGSTLRRTPEKREAEKMINQFEKLMIDVLNNMKTSVSGKIVFSVPLINTGRERVRCDYSKICLKTRLRIEEGFPLPEFREGQIVGREIVVMKR